MTAAFVLDELLTSAALNAAINGMSGIDPATGKLALALVPDATNAAIAAALAAAQAAETAAQTAETQAASAVTAAASSSGTGLTPPAASRFTYWFRRGEPTGTPGISLGGQSNLVDVPGIGLEVDIQTRTNDLWSIRFFGEACPTTPWELITCVRPSDIGYAPFWMAGPCLFKASSFRGVWSRYVIGRDQPICYSELDYVAFPSDGVSNTTWTLPTDGSGNWTRAHFVQRVYHRMVYDSTGYLTVFQSTISKNGPWRLFSSAPLDVCLNAAGTGAVPDYIGFAVNGLQELSFPSRQHVLIEHYDLHAYTGSARPTS